MSYEYVLMYICWSSQDVRHNQSVIFIEAKPQGVLKTVVFNIHIYSLDMYHLPLKHKSILLADMKFTNRRLWVFVRFLVHMGVDINISRNETEIRQCMNVRLRVKYTMVELCTVHTMNRYTYGTIGWQPIWFMVLRYCNLIGNLFCDSFIVCKHIFARDSKAAVACCKFSYNYLAW